MQDTGKPYTDLEEIRIIPYTTHQSELVWHRDREDRMIEVIGETDWEFQFDNQTPQQLKSEIFIPKDTYHRVIKGTGDLKIKIKKL